jgi:Pyridoxamine 5'-phosphate oxidase
LLIAAGCVDPEKEEGMTAEDVTAEIHGFSEPDATPTPWAAGLQQLRAADTFWLSTVRPDGRPHVTPLIAVWHAGALWFSTGPEERKARNLAENASCVLTTGRSDLAEGALDVVLEGRAEQVTDDAELEPVAAAFAAKYPSGPWDFAVRDGAFIDQGSGGRAIVFRVRPVRGLGFRKGDRFSQTTWRSFR